MPALDNFDVLFSLIFTVQAIPNIVLPFVTGIILDKLGARKCFIVTTTLCFVGQFISSVGVQAQSWTAVLLGNFVFGTGCESVFVSNTTLLSHWFASGRGIGLALGVSGVFSWAGCLASFVLGPPIANTAGLPFAVWVGTVFMAVSVIASIGVSSLDRWAEKRLQRAVLPCSSIKDSLSDSSGDSCMKDIERPQANEPAHTESQQVQNDEETTSQPTEDGSWFRLSSVLEFRCIFWLLCLSCTLNYATIVSFNRTVASGLLLERDLFVPTPQDCLLQFPHECSSGYLTPDGGNPPRDSIGRGCPAHGYAPAIPTSINITNSMPSWKSQSYVFALLQMTDIDCDDPFWSKACTKNYCDAQAAATEEAGRLISILYVTMIGSVVFIGHLTDKTGWRGQLLCLGPATTAVAHILLTFTRCNPALPLVLQGLGFAMAAATVWPSVSYSVDRNAVGTGTGVMTSVQNIGLALFPLLAAAILKSGARYIPEVDVFFIAFAFVAFLDGVAIVCIDRRSGSILSRVDDALA